MQSTETTMMRCRTAKTIIRRRQGKALGIGGNALELVLHSITRNRALAEGGRNAVQRYNMWIAVVLQSTLRSMLLAAVL